MIGVHVCYARPGHTFLRKLDVEPGTTIRQAIGASGVLEEVPEIDLAVCKVANNNKLKPLDTVLRERDRIEICRPLIADPKETRRRRALHKA